MKRITACAMTLALALAVRAFSEDAPKPDPSIFKDTMVDLTWEEVREAARDGAVVLLPIAVVEEHGPHMDLSPDIMQASWASRLIKRSLEREGVETLIAPPYYWGINGATGRFPGSFTLSEATMKAVLSDIVGCLKSWGFTKVFYVNLHGDQAHIAVIESSARELERTLKITVRNVDSMRVAVADPPAFPSLTPGYAPDYHAGAYETAAMWALYPERVRKGIALGLKPAPSFDNPQGYVGDPARFLSEPSMGEWMETWAELMSRRIEALCRPGAPATSSRSK